MTTQATPVNETIPPATALHRAITIQAHAATDAVRGAWERLLERMRVAFDVPSRTELAALTARLDALDARLAALAEAEGDERRNHKKKS